MQDLDPSDICKKKILNPLKRIRVIIRTPTHGRTDGRTDRQTDGQTDGQTGWIQYTSPQLRCGGYKNGILGKKISFWKDWYPKTSVWGLVDEKKYLKKIAFNPQKVKQKGGQNGSTYVSSTLEGVSTLPRSYQYLPHHYAGPAHYWPKLDKWTRHLGGGCAGHANWLLLAGSKITGRIQLQKSPNSYPIVCFFPIACVFP